MLLPCSTGDTALSDGFDVDSLEARGGDRAQDSGSQSNCALLTVAEVAELLRVPKSWVYGHLERLPTVRLGRYVRFRRAEIEMFLRGEGIANARD
jgi:excisionase family DNA binding protein